MTGCSLSPQRIQTEVKIINNPPALLNEISPPEFSYEPVVVINEEEAQYYQDACEALRDSPTSSKEWSNLSVSAACGWVIFGFTPQGWFNTLQNLIMLENYVDRLEDQKDFYKRQLVERYKAVQNVNAKQN